MTFSRTLVLSAAIPTFAVAQIPSSATRGCPPPPTTAVAAPPDGLPALNGTAVEIPIVAPADGWEIGRISWVAADRAGLIYLMQRGEKADPIVVMNRDGKVVRSWGNGLYEMPHGIRIDPQGNVWTTDAYTSAVIKFSPDGRELMRIDVGDVPGACAWRTRGATDIAFAPNGHVYVADGYANARVVEFTADGRKVKEWGTRGSGQREFNVPHSIVIDDAGVVYVADRENSRIQRFDLDGRWLGEWPLPGKPYTLDLTGNALWVDMLVVPAANVREPTLARVDRRDGKIIGKMIAPGGHGIGALSGGEQVLVPSGTRLHLISFPR